MEPGPKYTTAAIIRYPLVFGTMLIAAGVAFVYRKKLLGDLSGERETVLLKDVDDEGMKILQTHMKYAKT